MGDRGDLIEVNKAAQVLHIIRWRPGHLDPQHLHRLGQPVHGDEQEGAGEDPEGRRPDPRRSVPVNRERAQGWWEGELGQLYRPKYFRGGIAVHGSNNIPNYPASHGCVRVSTTAMDFIWAANLMPLGMPVWVHS